MALRLVGLRGLSRGRKSGLVIGRNFGREVLADFLAWEAAAARLPPLRPEEKLLLTVKRLAATFFMVVIGKSRGKNPNWL